MGLNDLINWYQSQEALDLGFKVLWSKNEGTDEVLEGTAQEYESTAGANLSTAEVYESTAHSLFKVLNAHIRYHLKELRYCAQCLIIENEDFVKRSRDHYMEPTEFEIQEMGLEVGWIRRIQELDTAYWGFLRVGTTLDIFQNMIFNPYLEYVLLSPLDTAYWSSE
ncbi:hypothetical protein Tco_1260207 [Tanacetum coccineum]